MPVAVNSWLAPLAPHPGPPHEGYGIHTIQKYLAFSETCVIVGRMATIPPAKLKSTRLTHLFVGEAVCCSGS